MNPIINHFFSNPIKIIVLSTLIYAIYKLGWKKSDYKYLILILSFCLITEIVNSVLISYGKSTKLSTTIGMFFYLLFSLLMLGQYTSSINYFRILFVFYVVFFNVNFLLVEGAEKFSYYSFVNGAFIYISIFIYESFYQLKKENFSFFLSNNYLLLFAPIIFFFCFSFMFSFNSKSVTSNITFLNFKLYDLVMYFANISYYTLINIYIYREKRVKNAG